jgi:hypothetical protein
MEINVGDRFIKTGVPSIVWKVSQILDVCSSIPHVLLVQELQSYRQITLSIPALKSDAMYTKLKQ